MASSDTAPVGFTSEQLPTANAPAWTVSSAAVPNSNTNMLLSNLDKKSPGDSGIPVPSAPEIGDLPPNYFDMSIVPDNAVLHYNKVVPYTEPSKAGVQRKKEGVLSFDPLIDKNPDQLRLYFMTYLNEKPTLDVNIRGYHIEVFYKYIF
jgi:hypothetical protein